MTHDLLTLTSSEDSKAEVWSKGQRCLCFSHASPGCPCLHHTLSHKPLPLPAPLSSDSQEHLPGFSKPDFFTTLSFGSSSLLSPLAHSAFQAHFPWKISLASLPEHQCPLGCDSGQLYAAVTVGSCMLAPHFELFFCLVCGDSAFFVFLPKGHSHKSFITAMSDGPVWQPRQDMSLSCASGEYCSLLL